MQFLLNHYHCILPVVLIGAALLLMRGKPKHKDDKKIEPREKE